MNTAALSQVAAAPLAFERLTCMSWDELQGLYRDAKPGNVPSGFVRGRTMFNPCEFLPGPRTKIANCLWKGKHFCAEEGTLVNQWLGVRAIRANIYPGVSWLDGQPSLILDYADSSLIWRDARDEMREVAPGLYVGFMHVRRCPEPRLKTLFVLKACRVQQ
ncbi:MAG: hypothetical protein L0Y71_00590 [Gemmataceae bacterium]|nr:hypothetical protein [Gemmataceae bacterium]